MRLVDDTPLYAKLLTSLKSHGTHRPLSPYEVCTLITRMVSELPNDREVMQRLSIKRDMLKAFLDLERLPEEYKYAVVWGISNKVGISFSSAHLVAKMKTSEDEKKILLRATQESEFSKDEIKDIISLRQREKSLSIIECIEKVKQIRPSLETYYIFVIPIPVNVSQGESTQCSSSLQVLEGKLNQFLSNLMGVDHKYSVKLRDRYAVITLDEDGYKLLKKDLRQRNALISELLGVVIRD